MISDFYIDKDIYGSGSRIVVEFIELFQHEFCNKIKKYAAYREADNEFEHLFYYGEQQTKSYITGVLDKICGSKFMQELQVQRRSHKLKRKHEVLNKGRVDYWCRYGSNTRVSILLEVKQSWIRYYNEKKWTFYIDALKQHQNAEHQIKSIKNKADLTVDNLFGLALTVLPLFTRYKYKKAEQVAIRQEVIHEVALASLKKTKADGYGCWIIPHKYCPIDTWTNDNSVKENENHPGIIFLWSIQKITRN